MARLKNVGAKTGDSAENSVKKYGENDDGCSKKMSEVR